ncbi:uncharacterized protein LY79DRAFT_584921 [Colletotrichum navitas]|uniref:Uncharacterized protein n=1 Tax=Colletotrichum navitas TaxID=681940 RepID=A0AAD8PK12_9PEZI|nr:uncharacterized protein LY79DRAFT_584921 [Colletotrichum navitas]KAK1566212.1 hypothetical protein LY79DRAFT_584921 [Colletotrichum navitas]
MARLLGASSLSTLPGCTDGPTLQSKTGHGHSCHRSSRISSSCWPGISAPGATLDLGASCPSSYPKHPLISSKQPSAQPSTNISVNANPAASTNAKLRDGRERNSQQLCSRPTLKCPPVVRKSSCRIVVPPFPPSRARQEEEAGQTNTQAVSTPNPRRMVPWRPLPRILIAPVTSSLTPVCESMREESRVASHVTPNRIQPSCLVRGI